MWIPSLMIELCRANLKTSCTGRKPSPWRKRFIMIPTLWFTQHLLSKERKVLVHTHEAPKSPAGEEAALHSCEDGVPESPGG